MSKLDGAGPGPVCCRVALPPVIKGVFAGRINRFVGEITLAGKRELAHVPSSGRMTELLYPGAAVYVEDKRGRGRLPYRILLAEYRGVLVSVDSLLPNRLAHIALQRGGLPEFAGWATVRREAALGQGRIDFLLEDGQGRKCFLEVKSVTLVREGTGFFPDAPTSRGARHLAELTQAAGLGSRAAVLFVVQRPDAAFFSPNHTGDPRFGEAFRRAAGAGVEMMARRCAVSMHEVVLGDPVIVERG